MARIFISHSSVNNPEAAALAAWLQSQGWNDLFLDLDAERGIVAGERWERALYEAANRCEAVIVLVSRAWLASRWCLRELQLAQKLNKRVFGLLVEELAVSGLPKDLTGTWQVVHLARGSDHTLLRATLPDGREVHVTFSQGGLERLRNGLAKAGLDARFFPWPPAQDPDRAPYRGLAALDMEDAGIFFGREAPGIAVLDRLRGLAAGAAPRCLVILGASGAGKSSFLRAGLLARLKRDDRSFLPLPAIRPQRAALSGDTGLLSSLERAMQEAGLTIGRARLKEELAKGTDGLLRLLQELADAVRPPVLEGESPAEAPTLVIPLDQAEELFLAEGAAESAQLQGLLRDIADRGSPRSILLIVIRSDSFERLQSAPAFEGFAFETFSLPPLPRGAYQQVIEGPARRLPETRRTLRIDPRLTEALLSDIEAGGGKDALPLLAFTLERLYLEYGGEGELRVSDYEALGGIRGSIEAAVERALKAADSDSAIPQDRAQRLALLRRALIPWLAGIDPESGTPRRRVARFSEIPEEARPLLRHLVEQRLLATDVAPATGEITVEPAHEALLRQWGLLQGWLEEDFASLATLEALQRATRDWAANARDPAWLSHAGGRLEDAEALLQQPDLAGMLGAEERDYLDACRRAETVRRERELKSARDLAAAKTRAARRTLIGALAAGILAIIAGGAAIYAVDQASASAINAEKFRIAAAEADAQRQAAQAVQSRLMASQAGFLVERGEANAALQLSLEALLGKGYGPAPPYHDELREALRDSLANDHLIRTIRVAGARVAEVALSGDGTRVLLVSSDGRAHLHDARSGERLLPPLEAGGGDRYFVPWLSHDGQEFALSTQSGKLRLFGGADVPTEVALEGEIEELRLLEATDGPVAVVLTASALSVYNSLDGRLLRRSTLPSGSGNGALSHDGRRYAVQKSGRIDVFDSLTGEPRWGFAVEGSPSYVAINRNGDTIAYSWSSQNKVWLVSESDAGAPVEFLADQYRVDEVLFSPASYDYGDVLLTFGWNGPAIWLLENGEVTSIRKPDGVQGFLDSGDFALRADRDSPTTELLRVRPAARGGFDRDELVSLKVRSSDGKVYSSADGGVVAAIAPDGVLSLYALLDPRTVPLDYGGDWTFVSFSNGDSAYIAIPGALYRIGKDEERLEYVAPLSVFPQDSVSIDDAGRQIAFQANGDWYLYGLSEDELTLLQAPSGFDMAYARFVNDRLLAVVAGPTALEVRDVAADSTISSVAKPPGSMGVPWLSPNGRHLFLESDTQTLLHAVVGRDAEFALLLERFSVAADQSPYNFVWEREASGDILCVRSNRELRQIDLLSRTMSITPLEALGEGFVDASQMGTGLAANAERCFVSDWWNSVAVVGKDGTIYERERQVISSLDFQSSLQAIEAFAQGTRLLVVWGAGLPAVKILRTEGTTEELMAAARDREFDCLTASDRRRHGLDDEPPAWCIEDRRWPYANEAWRLWLGAKLAGEDPPMPAPAD